MSKHSFKISNLLTKIFMAVIFILSTIQLFRELPDFVPYIVQSIVFGIPVWIVIGAIAPYLAYFLIVKPIKTVKRNLYILKPKNSLMRDPLYYRVLSSFESSLGPTLLAFGILNLALNYFDFVFELGLIIIVIILVFGLGFVVPMISVVADSDLVILKEEKRTIEPFGLRLQSHLRGISGFTAVLGLTYNLLTMSGDIVFTITLLTMVFSLTYPPLVVIKAVYDQIHPFFVAKLNKMLEKSFRPCRVIVKINDTLKNSYFMVERG